MSPKKWKVTAVSYLNTKPLLYGIFKSEISSEISLELDIPSVGAQKLKSGLADFGLVPVAIIPELHRPSIISNFCIGATGEVRTVCIYANTELQNLETIYLDFHSRTSVELTRILLKEYWKIQPRLVPAFPGYESKITGKTGGLIIGDRAIELESQFRYHYDLGEAWKNFTGLPFVFAAWVTTKPLPEDFIYRFNEALQRGIAEIPQLIYLLPNPTHPFDLNRYFTKYISYNLDEDKKTALKKYLHFLQPDIEITFQTTPSRNTDVKMEDFR